MPRKVFYGNSGPYLTRYVLKYLFGFRVLLHNFHRHDEDIELHNHPWYGISLILSGGYIEERTSKDSRLIYRKLTIGSINFLKPNTFHRIIKIDKNTWSLLLTSPIRQEWGFWNSETREYTPWRIFIANKESKWKKEKNL